MKKSNLTCELFQEGENASNMQMHLGAWRWRVRAKNGKLVCTSGEAFDSKSNAKRAWKKFEQQVRACWIGKTRTAWPESACVPIVEV